VRDEVDLGFELKFETLCTAAFMHQVVEEARPWVGLSEWTSDTATFLDRLDGIDGVESLVKKREEGFEESVFYLTGCIVLLQVWRGQVVLRVAGDRKGRG